MSKRISVRLPEDAARQLEERARSAGYSSAAALVRCVLVQFLSYGGRTGSLTDWISGITEAEEDGHHRVNPAAEGLRLCRR